jgi:hypothetical protein
VYVYTVRAVNGKLKSSFTKSAEIVRWKYDYYKC